MPQPQDRAAIPIGSKPRCGTMPWFGPDRQRGRSLRSSSCRIPPRSPHAAAPDTTLPRTAKEYGRSAAPGRLWCPGAGATRAGGFALAPQRKRRPRKKAALSARTRPVFLRDAQREFSVREAVDNNRRRRLYKPLWTRRRRRLVRWLVREAPHCSYGEASGHEPWRMSDVRVSAAPGHTGDGVPFGGPGCLTGESEERETWTAESLRAASSNGEGLPSSARQKRPEETSAVDVSGQHS